MSNPGWTRRLVAASGTAVETAGAAARMAARMATRMFTRMAVLWALAALCSVATGAAAQTLVSGGPYAGDIAIAYEVDRYTFTGIAGETVMLTASRAVGSSALHPHLRAGDPVFLWANEGLEQVPLAALPGLVTIGDSGGTVPAPATGWLVALVALAGGRRPSGEPSGPVLAQRLQHLLDRARHQALVLARHAVHR